MDKKIDNYAQGLISKIDILYEVPVHGGDRGVMVIVVGNGHGDKSSNPRRD